MEEKKHILSIIAVAFNEAEHIAKLGRALNTLDLPSDISKETILIDGGSTDGTVKIAGEAGFSLIVELPGASIPVCRNRGVKEAQGDWIAFLDADCVPSENWAEKAGHWLNSKDPTVIGWPVEPPDERTWVQEAWYMHWAHKNASQRDEAGGVRDQAFRLITTRNMLFTRSVLTRIDGFDEDLPTGEDTDFVFRASNAGIQVIGVPDLRVVHYGEPATLKAFFRQQIWHANRSSYAKIAKATGGKVGGNAPKFALAFALSSFLLVAGSILACVTRNLWLLLAAGPLLAVVALPALLMAWRARSMKLAIQLMPLYAAYGWARALDLCGFFRAKPSWKSK